MVGRMDKVKGHFEDEAREYDGIIQRLIPFYNEMLEALIGAIPFGKYDKFKVVDLGCGTGTISAQIKRAFPNAQILCLDLAENMIRIAQAKLAGYEDIVFAVGDFNEYDFEGSYDVIVSSLALHHLGTDKAKISFYKKLFNRLSSGGVFYNADVVLASNERMQAAYMEKWKAYMRRSVPADEVERVWIAKYYEEDRPAPLMKQMDWLHKAGFKETDVIWKYYNFAVYGGMKRA